MEHLHLPFRVATESGDDGSIEDATGDIIARVVDNVAGSKRHINRLRTASAITAACNAHDKLATENAQLRETLARADEVANAAINAALATPDPVRQQMVAALQKALDVLENECIGSGGKDFSDGAIGAVLAALAAAGAA